MRRKAKRIYTKKNSESWSKKRKLRHLAEVNYPANRIKKLVSDKIQNKVVRMNDLVNPVIQSGITLSCVCGLKHVWRNDKGEAFVTNFKISLNGAELSVA